MDPKPGSGTSPCGTPSVSKTRILAKVSTSSFTYSRSPTGVRERIAPSDSGTISIHEWLSLGSFASSGIATIRPLGAPTLVTAT